MKFKEFLKEANSPTTFKEGIENLNNYAKKNLGQKPSKNDSETLVAYKEGETKVWEYVKDVTDYYLKNFK